MIETTSPHFWRATLALCLASFIVFANLHGMQPLLPMLADSLGRTELEISHAYTIATLVLGLSLLVYGPVSDVLGRRGILLLTLAGVALTTLGLGFVDNYSSLFWLRALQGFFLAGVPAVAIAYMGDEFSRPALLTAVGLYIASNSLGGVTGRLLAGAVGDWLGWSEVFLLLGVISTLGLLLVIRLLPSSSHFNPVAFRPQSMLLDLLGHLRNPVLFIAYLVGGLNFLIFLNQYTYITFVLAAEPFSLSATWIGLLFLTYLTGTFGSLISGRLSRRFTAPLCMALGIVVLMLGTLLTLVGSLPAIICGFFINSFGFFLTHSVASSWVSQQAVKARASASALYLVFYYVGASVGGFYLHPFWQLAGWTGIVVGSLLIFLITLGCAMILLYWQRSGRVSAFAG
ncbi:MFS transporter [Nitrincola iocasae]|uniref:MFS transporter n=1 Tax=Nitrincola iocasae TaxID=2614693 RepID=A0A5J6LHD3_9GAMM|nr:MFS transporter [Nitrincola iocasae]QEW07964.1 MFS transporter [Nitrincola iocasae]